MLAWAGVTTILNAPSSHAIPAVIELGVAFVLFGVIAHGVQSFRSLETMAATLALIALFLAFVGIHQGLAPTGCVKLHDDGSYNLQTGTFDGRPCEIVDECYEGEPEPGARYRCEHVGLLGTTTIEGRVRYRGILQDPNELAMAPFCSRSCRCAAACACASWRRWPWRRCSRASS